MNELVTQIRNQQWIAMVQNQKSSGLTVKAWCEENHISENCFYYRQQRLREIVGSEFSGFAEIKRPVLSAAPDLENMNSAAVIHAGRVRIDLSNSASAELITKIVRALNAQ